MRTQSVPYATFRAGVLAYYDAGSKSPKTRAKMIQVLDALGALPGVKTTADLSATTIGTYLASLNCNANTARGYLGYLRTACQIGVEQGLVRARTLPNWRRLAPKPLKMTRNPVKTFTQVQTLLNHQRERATDWKSRRLLALTSLFAFTGMRRDEALYSKLADFDWSARILRVVDRPERPLKTAASARSIPVCPELAEALRGWLPWVASEWLFPQARRQGPWTTGSDRDRPLGQIQASARAAGLGHVTIHGMRHSFATMALRDWRLPLWAVSKVLGHTSIRTTERYLHLDDPALLSAEAQAIRFQAPQRA